MRVVRQNLVFVSVGVILVAGVLGSVFYLKNYLGQSNNSQEVTQTEEGDTASEATSATLTEEPQVDVTNTTVVEVSDAESVSVILPQTGVDINFLSIVGVFALAFAVATFSLSFQQRLQK